MILKIFRADLLAFACAIWCPDVLWLLLRCLAGYFPLGARMPSDESVHGKTPPPGPGARTDWGQCHLIVIMSVGLKTLDWH